MRNPSIFAASTVKQLKGTWLDAFSPQLSSHISLSTHQILRNSTVSFSPSDMHFLQSFLCNTIFYFISHQICYFSSYFIVFLSIYKYSVFCIPCFILLFLAQPKLANHYVASDVHRRIIALPWASTVLVKCWGSSYQMCDIFVCLYSDLTPLERNIHGRGFPAHPIIFRADWSGKSLCSRLNHFLK